MSAMSATRVPRGRRGFALLLVLIASSIMLGVALAMMPVASTSSGMARARRQLEVADAAAITGVGYMLDEWPLAWRTMANGATDTRNYTIGTVTVAATLTRETATNYRIDITAMGTNVTSVRTVRLTRPFVSMAYTEPIVSLGTIIAHAGGTVVGSDDPACPNPRLADQPAFLLPSNTVTSDSAFNYSGTAGGMTVTDATLSATSMSTLGDWTLAGIAALPNLSYATGTSLTGAQLTQGTISGGSCGTAWGSPTSSTGGCESYYPIIYSSGTLTVGGGAGQGQLISDGTVTINGGHQFWGLIVVRSGSLTITGAGTKVSGRILMLDPAGTLTIGSGATVQLSSCAVANISAGRVISTPSLRGALLDQLGMAEVR
jgi:hypothetical protein